MAKHAVVKYSPIEIEGHKVGESMSIEYQDGPPEFGVCMERNCKDIATEETLIGMQFCETHFGKFYSHDAMDLKAGMRLK